MGFDVLAILTIIAIDIALGIDNAVVIALACMGLEPKQRKRAMMIGTAGAIIARIVLLFVGFILVAIPYLKLVAGLYLVYLAYKMFKGEEEDEGKKNLSKSELYAIWVVISSDIVMSIDNVIAVVSASSKETKSLEGLLQGDLWTIAQNIFSYTIHSDGFGYAVMGILFSIPIILVASSLLIKLIDKYPFIMWIGAWLIAYIGFDMIAKEHIIEQYLTGVNISEKVFAIILSVVMVAIAIVVNKPFKKA